MAKGFGKGKCAPPPPPPRRMCGEILTLNVATLTGKSATIEVSRLQSVRDVLRAATAALDLPWLSGGLYALVIGSVKLAESHEGRQVQCRSMHMYPSLFELGTTSACLVRQSNQLCPGQEVKVSFTMARELHEHPIKQIHGKEGIISGWMADESAWLVKMYGGNHFTSIFYLIQPRHMLMRNHVVGAWTKPDVLEGDSTMPPKDTFHMGDVVRASELIDDALGTAAEMRRRAQDEFDRQRRTMEWAEQEGQEREARFEKLIADGPPGAICLGSHPRTSQLVDARWEQYPVPVGNDLPSTCHVAALAADLAPRILPLRFGRIM